MKITFGIIVFNGQFFLRQVLESIYPFAHAICIAEGPVSFWEKAGHHTSSDKTNDIIDNFPDPENKIFITHGQYLEKDQQCQAWFKMVPHDTDYIICNDADEIHSPENLENLIRFLERASPTSVGFKSDSFFGGFERIIGGFERDHSFKRVLKYLPGSHYRTHRQPTLCLNDADIAGNDITGNQLYNDTGITMWHGSYVSARQVFDKINYYEKAVIATGQCIPSYFEDVWLRWVNIPEQREEIEKRWNGVQEFIPAVRGECFTIPYTGAHPPVIQKYLPELIQQFDDEVKLFNVCSRHEYEALRISRAIFK